MIKKIYIIETADKNPYHNLALEEVLLRAICKNECILYLWQNERTVVIGRNQNAANECRISALEGDGGHLARRLSGGGAVYHDLGNLNFTFLLASEDYDLDKQNEIILGAVRKLGLKAEKDGRNDLTIDGRKFSGHAFYHSGGNSYHHGTIMVDVDREPLSHYLNVSPLKLSAKGVRSVRSRVVNLKELDSSITVEGVARALRESFEELYGMKAEEISEEEIERLAGLDEAIERFSSDEWIYGRAKPLPYIREARFDWGTVRVDFALERCKAPASDAAAPDTSSGFVAAGGAGSAGSSDAAASGLAGGSGTSASDSLGCFGISGGDVSLISDVHLYSDGMDADYLRAAGEKLKGCAYEASDIESALLSIPNMPQNASKIAADIAGLVTCPKIIDR